MNVLDNGKYRSTTEWNSSSSIPALVDITEQNEEPNSGEPSPESIYKQSTNRRSSLGIFRKPEFEKNSRRRTSLANPFVLFGRRDSHKVLSKLWQSFELYANYRIQTFLDIVSLRECCQVWEKWWITEHIPRGLWWNGRWLPHFLAKCRQVE